VRVWRREVVVARSVAVVDRIGRARISATARAGLVDMPDAGVGGGWMILFVELLALESLLITARVLREARDRGTQPTASR
jgi:hypothetical protein